MYFGLKPHMVAVLILALALCGVSFSQGHQTHESQISAGAENRQNSEPSLRPLSDLIRDSEKSMRIIRQVVRKRDVESLDRAVDSYIGILTETRDAFKHGVPHDKNFGKDVARVEKVSKTNFETLGDLAKSAPKNFRERLAEALVVTDDTYSAASSLRKEIYSEKGESQGGHGSGYGSEGLGGGHHRGWFSRGHHF
ncbi:MAG: hypothetical protein HY644_06515 [Acidobacteria bacterium]|nr:hypothetical protein [Acidobacteriota bacterium]